MRVRVKICGITRLEDAQAATAAGADALGFMFYAGSPRCIALAEAAEISRRLPPLISRVGVFVNPSEPEVRQALAGAGLNAVQFHGEESPEFCARFAPTPVIKAFRIRGEESLAELKAFTRVQAWLLDAWVKGARGGTGARFNWSLALEARTYGVPILLAGGLTPENAAQAAREVQPFALDVSSGVESGPGLKDAEKVRAFLAAVKAVDA
jgi:phosphoribosylanthranilate isomerase